MQLDIGNSKYLGWEPIPDTRS